MTEQQPAQSLKGIARVVSLFLNTQLCVLLIALALSAGVIAILVTPREEEPQIVVPFADVFVQAPGASPGEVEKLVASPLEKLLWQIDGVEYVYSVSRQDLAIVSVRFRVGEDRVQSLVKLHNQISMNIDQAPPLVTGWVIRPLEIDDVPIVSLTLYSDRYDSHQLRRIGEEAISRLTEVEDISRSTIIGGRPREIRVELSPERLAGFGLSMLQVEQALQGADAAVHAGTITRAGRNLGINSKSFFASAREVERLVVGVHEGRPVYLGDVAVVLDGPAEAVDYCRIGFSSRFLALQSSHPAAQEGTETLMAGKGRSFAAVTLALAKKKGTNAVWVAADILAKMEELRKSSVIPDGVYFETTRNYGQTAQEKVDDLLKSLFFAVLTVVVLLAITLGWREAMIVALAVPISFSLSLLVNYLFGFTINRVTLFALILSLGLVVDDPITNVDNIQRHIFLRQRDPRQATLYAVNEVLPPVIMSTLAIIVSFVPLFFITGMMGPYMAPMAVNVPLTVTFSTLAALSIVPWLSLQLLKGKVEKGNGGQAGRDVVPDWIRRNYRRVLMPFMESRRRRWLLLTAVLIGLAGSLSLVLLRIVPLKMLPFDNKNEFQLVIDMPEGTPLEATDRVVRDFEEYLRLVPEVTNFVSYAGTASPMDFNGMIRQFYLRQGGHLADLRVNLLPRNQRRMQSHELVLRLRPDLDEIAHRHGANLKIVELPPGPPVLSTIVAEIYGTAATSYQDLIKAAGRVQEIMHREPFVTDIDNSIEEQRELLDFVLDKEKAALHGITTEQVMRTLQLAVSGGTPAAVHIDRERQPLLVKMILPRERRTSINDLNQLPLGTPDGRLVPFAEVGRFSTLTEEQPIYHKNLKQVVYVVAEMAGRAPAEAIIDMQRQLAGEPLPPDFIVEWAGEGEWKITIEVFRDLGIAFGVALLGIYALLSVQTGSFFLPLLILLAVPLTLLGIMPGFWLLNLIASRPIGDFANPVFFTATSMIGMIALGGIVIRNSVVLIDFIRESMAHGEPFRDAILQSGAIRLRPIVLTAMTTALGAWPITLDPIFSGLAWALIFGLFASTLFTLLIVPLAYYALFRKQYEKESQDQV